MRSLVVAHDLNRVIGNRGDIPWLGDVPEDMRHFKRLTEGGAVIMGRATYDSIGKPLPNRRNIVISRNVLVIAGCEVVRGIEEAFETAEDGEARTNSYVIGGGQIYEQAMPQVDQLHVTVVQDEFEGDAFFPEIDQREWLLVSSRDHLKDEKNKYDMRFYRYERANQNAS
jgi:dihydrofolate reductase